MIPVALTPAAGDGATLVFTAASYVRDEEVYLDRLRQIPTTDYTASVVAGVTVLTFVVAPVNGAVLTLWGNVLQATAAGLANYDTVATLISDAAVELGIVAADIADPYASTDQNIILLLRLLKSGGRELAKHRAWKQMLKEYTFNLADATQSYALPADFRSMIDDSGWDRTTQMPLGGPLDSKDWQFLKAVSVASNISYRFRVWQGRLYVDPTPSAVTDTVAYEYNSTSWITPATSAQPTADGPTAATDLVCFEKRLVVARLKRDFRRNKKQDSQAEEDDYQAALSDAENEDAQARTIYFGGRLGRTPRRIDRWNLPDVIG